MKTLVCYFSATGNGYALAEQLAEALSAEDIRNIQTLGKQVVASYEQVVLVSPVHFYGLPLPVENFIKAQAGNFHTKFYLVMHYAGFRGNAKYGAYMKFKENVLLLQNVYTLHMPGSYTIAMSHPESLVRFLLQYSKHRINKITKKIQDGEKKKIRSGMFAFMDGVHKNHMKQASSFAKDYVVTDDCTHCGHCARICPMKNIKVTAKEVKFRNTCAGCLACFNRCPKGAINYGTRTIGKKRYQNPEVDFDGMKK